MPQNTSPNSPGRCVALADTDKMLKEIEESADVQLITVRTIELKECIEKEDIYKVLEVPQNVK